jgi:uncharacterized protein YgiM (DUF1202 family)
MFAFWISATVALAAEGTVQADTAKIRKEASTDSEVIGSTSNGSKIDVVGGVKDASGTVWYKVPNGNNTYGYIRSDLLKVSGDVKITENSAGSSDNSSNQGSAPEATVPTVIAEQQATTNEVTLLISAEQTDALAHAYMKYGKETALSTWLVPIHRGDKKAAEQRMSWVPIRTNYLVMEELEV